MNNGFLSGGMSNVVFYKMNDEQIVRAKPAQKSKRTKLRRRTDKQWKQQARFAEASRVANFMKELLNQTFEKTKGQIGKCQAISYILSSAIQGEYPDYRVDFSKMLIARGRALKAEGATVSSTAENKLEFSWDTNTGTNYAAAEDQAILVAYGERSGKVFYTLKGFSRRNGKGELPLMSCSGSKMHVWISFRKRNGETADSVYLGEHKIL